MIVWVLVSRARSEHCALHAEGYRPHLLALSFLFVRWARGGPAPLICCSYGQAHRPYRLHLATTGACALKPSAW
jgi:hypothetical protein